MEPCREPHEDGPRYHPVVATLSLGSHCVMHYYRYADEESRGASPAVDGSASRGRAIDPKPVMSILLERRSLVITSGAFYTSHLHGCVPTRFSTPLCLINCGVKYIRIEGIVEDHIQPPLGNAESPNANLLATDAVRISNWDLLQDEELKDRIRRGESLRRSTRWSLTCRDVPKVSTNIQRLRGIVRR